MKKNLHQSFMLGLLLVAIHANAQTGSPNWKFLRSSNTGVGGDYIQTIEVDRFGNKWTGGYMPFWSEGSVARFNDTVWTNWSNFEGYLPADRVYDLAFDYNDGLWVTTNGVGNGVAHGGISHYDGLTWNTYTTANSPLPVDDMRGICVDQNNTVWATFYDVSSGIGGVSKFDGTTWTIYTPGNSALSTAMVDKIDVDAQGNVYVGSNAGLLKFNGSVWSAFTSQNSGLTNNNVTDVEFDALTNKIYVAAGISIDVLDGTTWSHFNSSNSPLSATGLWAVDAHGDSMIVTTLGGTYLTYVFDGLNWTTHPEAGHTYDARIDNDGNFWICGIGFVEKFDGTNWTTYTRYNTGLTTYFTGSLFVDSKNRKWFGTNDNGGINMFDCPIWEDYGPWNSGLWPSPQTPSTSGGSVTEDIYGNIWMTYVYGAIVKIPNGDVHDSSAWVTWQYTSLPNATCRIISADSSGNVWADGGCGLALRYDSITNGWIPYNLYAMGLPCGSNNYMYAINTDPYTGKVWFCTQAGIAIYDNGNWTIWSQTNGMLPFQNDYYDVAFDSQGNAWIGTDNGLIKHNGTTWTIYDESNSGILANHVPSITIDSNDQLYMNAFNVTTAPYYGGFNIFDGNTTWQSFAFGNSPMPHYQLEALQLDQLGNLWINSSTEGTIIYNPNGVQGWECIDQTIQIGNPTGLASSPSAPAGKIIALPNPLGDHTTLNFTITNLNNSTLTVFDITGREVLTMDASNFKPGLNSVELDFQELESGVYFCTVNSGTEINTVRLVKK